MAKNTEKIVRSLKLYRNFSEEWDEMSPKAAGGKGEQLSAGIMAYMGIYNIDKGLASALTNPDLDAQKAAKLILESMGEIIYHKALENLTPEQRVQILQDAKQSKQKVFRKK